MQGVIVGENGKLKAVFEAAPYGIMSQVTVTMLPVFKAGSFD
jgi:hypothetical protein